MRTTIYADPGVLRDLRHLAVRCDLLQTRGIGIGEMGSMSQLLAVLASGYTADPDRVVGFMTALKRSQERPQPPSATTPGSS
jgi:hypothetical protein